MKKISLILLCLLLAGCVTPTQQTSDAHKFPPIAHRYQAQNAVGNTNPDARMKAFSICGLPSHRYNDMLTDIYGMHAGDDDWDTVKARAAQFEQCMKGQGYTFLTNRECGSTIESRQLVCK